MIENIERLLRRHMVLFVVFRDEELEAHGGHGTRRLERCLARGHRRHAAARARGRCSRGCAGWASTSSTRRPSALGVEPAERLSRSEAARSAVGAACTSCTLKSHRFRKEREADWRRLEELLARAEAGRRQRSATTRSGASGALPLGAVVAVGRARHFAGPGAHRLSREPLHARLFLRLRHAHDVRQAASRVLQARLAARGAGPVARNRDRRRSDGAGAVVAYLLVHERSDLVLLVRRRRRWPAARTGGGDRRAARDLVRARQPSGLSVFATFLFTHNAQVALFAFALGFAFCLPTAFLGLQWADAGRVRRALRSRGLGIEFGGWLSIHGVTELFAIALSGAAGFRLGWTLAFPGPALARGRDERGGAQGGDRHDRRRGDARRRGRA